ncbi:hypothetical protein, partial [Klebsiella pneumoniae]|uniref:hypothetical protein n=1 Tax=Klebsiella pneumoniae TaxID=573 RepID=UPI0022473F01|nr:hypothetical protein [Klebsiella pneumoniae]
TELTDQIVDKFTTVIDLQKFLLNKSVLIAYQENYLAKKKFFLTLLISSISLAAALLTLIYAKRRVF